MNLTRIVYSSADTSSDKNLSKLQQLRDILASAQKNNAKKDITGFLIYDGHFFLQILEGDRETVVQTFDRIKRDNRHDSVHLMDMTPLENRQFADWSMGGSMRSLDAQEIYLKHGIGSAINPEQLSAHTVVNLALDLQEYERQVRHST